MTKKLATDYISLDLQWLPRKMDLVWKVTQPGINQDLTCQHINGELCLSNVAKICMSKYFYSKTNYMS